MLFMYVYMLFIQHAWQCNCQYVGITEPMGTIGTGTLRSSKWGMGMAQNQRILWVRESIIDFSTLREMYLHITNLYHDRCVAIAIFSLFRHFQLWFRCEKLRGWKCATTFIIIYRSICKKRPSATVDGRNPAPVEVGSLSHYIYLLYRDFFFTSQVVIAGFLNHQQYLYFFTNDLNHAWYNAACPLRFFLAGASRPTMSFEAENSREIGRMIWRVGRNSISHKHSWDWYIYLYEWLISMVN